MDPDHQQPPFTIGLLPLLAVHSKASLWIVYIVLFFKSTIEQVVLPAESALLPSLVNKDLLVSANALISVSTNTSRLAGAALGGLLLGLVGLGGATLFDALSFMFVSAMVVFISKPTKSARLERERFLSWSAYRRETSGARMAGGAATDLR